VRRILATIIRRIVVCPERVDIQLLRSQLDALLRDQLQSTTSAITTADDVGQPVILSTPAQLRRSGLGIRR